MAELGIPVNSSQPANLAGASVADFMALLKPRVMSLVVFTAFTGMMLAPGHLHPVLAATAILSIAVGAGASGALNMWYDADIDARMQRTAGRPIPRGRVSPEEALAFGVILAVGSVTTLGLIINWVAGGLLALTIAFYLFVYTIWLKRRTPHNIVIGGAAGAFPPMIGWAAATGSISLESVVLFLIIFMWTPPHFWALALYRVDDYAKASVPMLPVIAGKAETRRQILIYSALLVMVAFLPALLNLGGAAYALTAIVASGVLLARALTVHRVRDGRAAERAARRLFAYSIVYLFVLFAVLLLEAVFGRYLSLSGVSLA